MAEKKKRKFTRRSFLKGASIAGVGIAAAGPLSKLLNIGPDSAMADTEFGGGYAGKILHVDLGGGHLGNVGGTILTTTEPTYKYADRFLGARGIHEWMIFNHVPIDADPLGEESLICLGAGPLNGTLSPYAARLEITTLNVQTGGTSHSNGGSDVCSEMKYAGYDNIIISGKASSPSYLYIEDGRVELRDAFYLWGKNQMEARNIVREELGDKRICSVGIGVAGENLSKIACIHGDAWHAHGGFGIGAIMGSKNLKLVAVRGHGAVKVADPEKFKETVDALWKAAPLQGPAGFWEGNVGGYNKSLQTSAYWPPWRSRNGQWRGVERSIADVEKFDHKVFDDRGYTGRRYTCRHCPKADHGHFYKITDGPNAGMKSKWIMTCVSTSFLKELDPVPDYITAADTIRWTYLVDSLGLEDGHASNTISWALECYQRGLLTTEDTGGIELNWPTTDNEIIFQVMEAIAYRRGKLGELLGDGAYEAAKKIAGRLSDEGKPPEYYVLGTKKGGLHYEQDLMNKATKNPDGSLKFQIAWAFQCTVSIRGGKHSNPYGEPPASTMTPEEYANMKNASKYEEKGRLTSYGEWMKEVVDSLGICWQAPNYTSDKIAPVLNYATGSSFTGDSLVLMGKKLFNIAKAINTLRMGFTRENDMPRERELEDLTPLPGHLDINKWNEQLDKYYDFHGWDRETGWQKRKTLNDLDLGQVAIALWREDKLK